MDEFELRELYAAALDGFVPAGDDPIEAVRAVAHGLIQVLAAQGIVLVQRQGLWVKDRAR